MTGQYQNPPADIPEQGDIPEKYILFTPSALDLPPDAVPGNSPAPPGSAGSSGSFLSGKSGKSEKSGKSPKPESPRRSLRIDEIDPENRPRERLKRCGPGALSNAELAAVILRTGTRQENILQICQRLFSEYTLPGLSRAGMTKLRAMHGIGEVKAAQICAVFELARRLEMYSDEPKRKITSPSDVFDIVHAGLRGEKKEHFIVLFLNTKNQVLKEEVISIGSLNASIVHPREIFRQAVIEAAASVILVHNHPSGDPKPSDEDIEMTERVCRAGDVVGIDVLDHIIIGDHDFVSMKQEGYMRHPLCGQREQCEQCEQCGQCDSVNSSDSVDSADCVNSADSEDSASSVNSVTV